LYIRSGSRNKLINLSSEITKYGISKVADPKLFKMGGDDIYITFNTGYSKTKNEIFFSKVSYEEISAPVQCNYNERNSVEKNWAFFSHEESLYAIYSLNPLIILAADCQCSSVKAPEINFHKVFEQYLEGSPSLSIGTQLLKTSDNGEYLLLAHKKISLRKKRMYLGVLVKFDFQKLLTNEISSTITFGENYIFHSLKSLLGSRKKWNKHLFSCTYFSGLSQIDDSYILSYGVNDVNFGIKQIQQEDAHKNLLLER